ncbi:M48 family metalloprotease [Massilia sp. W12]|uniref:M48 family metalloprotease n=1 Tax=Massilia sp. W12 TaxID=3126507 RepID=UPI0030D3C93C
MMANAVKKICAGFLLSAGITAPAILAQAGSGANLPELGVSGRQDLSPQAERRLGEEVMRDIRRDRDYLEDAPLLEYLNRFGNDLLTVRPDARGEAGFDFFFFGVRDPMLNAFALPGGFIGVHSGLLLAAQNESELASVLSHEIGHVAQRHIARMLGQQKQDALIPLAAMVLAVLAARSNPDASLGIMAGGETLALQRQMSFSRDAEREADRLGFQLLQEAGFDTSGMVAFFKRMQNATRAYTDNTPAYMRSHPLTTERIADIEARNRELRYRQRADSLEFHLIRARARILQDDTNSGWDQARIVFQSQLETQSRQQSAAGHYGLALIALRQGQYVQAGKALRLAQQASQAAEEAALGRKLGQYQHPVLAHLANELAMAQAQDEAGLRQAIILTQTAHQQFPFSRGLALQYAQALRHAGKLDTAVLFLRDQIQLYRQEPVLHEQLAATYARQGKLALQHMSLGESYALRGSLQAAIEQMELARRAGDGNFYDHALIDARLRQFQADLREQNKERSLRGEKGAQAQPSALEQARRHQH